MKRLLLFLLACSGAHAQTAQIGRLFTTPEERHKLDIARGTVAAPPAPPPVTLAPPPAPPAAPVTLNGMVRRSAGPSTVWLNQEAQHARVDGTRVTVTLPSGERVRIKPGQTVDPNAGAVKDVATP